MEGARARRASRVLSPAPEGLRAQTRVSHLTGWTALLLIASDARCRSDVYVYSIADGGLILLVGLSPICVCLLCLS